jgi:hypothetical protein
MRFVCPWYASLGTVGEEKEADAETRRARFKESSVKLGSRPVSSMGAAKG